MGPRRLLHRTERPGDRHKEAEAMVLKTQKQVNGVAVLRGSCSELLEIDQV